MAKCDAMRIYELKTSVLFRDTVPAMGVTENPKVKISTLLVLRVSFENMFSWAEGNIC